MPTSSPAGQRAADLFFFFHWGGTYLPVALSTAENSSSPLSLVYRHPKDRDLIGFDRLISLEAVLATFHSEQRGSVIQSFAR